MSLSGSQLENCIKDLIARSDCLGNCADDSTDPDAAAIGNRNFGGTQQLLLRFDLHFDGPAETLVPLLQLLQRR